MAIMRGSEGTVRIGTTTYSTKKLLNFLQEGEVFKDPSNAGFIKHVGNTDVNFDAEIWILREDLAGLITASKTDANGKIPTSTVVLSYGDIDGNSFSISGTAFVSSLELIDASGEEKVVARIHVEYTGVPTAS